MALLMKLLLSGLILLSSSIIITRMIAVYSTNTAETTSSHTTTTISSNTRKRPSNTTKTTRPTTTCKVNDRDEDDDSLYGFFIVTNPVLVNTTTVKCDNCDLLEISDCDIVDCDGCVTCSIENAKTVYCNDCLETTISNVESVYCNGNYGCSETTWIGNTTFSVYCNGVGSCNSNRYIQAKELVECTGAKSCGSATIKARHVVCTGDEACGSQLLPADPFYNSTPELLHYTHITSTCLVCANGGCSGSGGSCLWNGEPCPSGGIATKHCVVGGAFAKATTTDQVTESLIRSNATSVYYCNGDSGCSESSLIRNATSVYCNGIKSCRNTDIQATELIECTGAKSCATPHYSYEDPIIQARHVVCNGNETCGFQQETDEKVYTAYIYSACLVCANGGCKEGSGGTPTCFWNGEPCPSSTTSNKNGMTIKHCVVGASIKATGQVIRLAAIPYTKKIMVEIDVEPHHQRDTTLFRGSVRVRVNDAFSSFQGEFESASIFLAYVKKECAIIKGTGKVNDVVTRFSLTLCKAKDGNTTMNMDIANPRKLQQSGMHTIADATLQGTVDVKLMVGDHQNFETSQQQTAIY